MSQPFLQQFDIVLFDLDGTIVDSALLWLDWIRQGLDDFGVALSPDFDISPYTHDFRTLTQVGLPEDMLPAFLKHQIELANRELPKAPLHRDVLAVITQLHIDGKKLGIFSTGERAIFEPIIARHDLGQYIPALVAGNDVGERKPHPAGIHRALEILGEEPMPNLRAIYIGDKDTDIQAAHNAGIAAALFYPATHQQLYERAELTRHNPEHVFESWTELLQNA